MLVQQASAVSDPMTGAVGEANRPDRQWQSHINSAAPPPFMAFFPLSDIRRSSIGQDHLAHDVGDGYIIPKPSLIWGVNGRRRVTMLETVTSIWKLLVVRSSLFKRGDLTRDETYLSTAEWRSILNRVGTDTDQSAMWRNGKRELWGSSLLPSVVQRVQEAVGQPTLKKMECFVYCSPIGKFNEGNDPQKKLEHLALFRLAELNVLHDFASYHPDLQLIVDGRWCPPPFDAQDALDDRPNTFPEIEVSDSVFDAMEEISRVVRWNGRDGLRGWEMADGPSYREWLAALRGLLCKCPSAWTNNRIFDESAAARPGVNLLECDLMSPDAPVKTIAWVMAGTHIILCMRAGRVPTRWFNKPALTDLSICDHGPV